MTRHGPGALGGCESLHGGLNRQSSRVNPTDRRVTSGWAGGNKQEMSVGMECVGCDVRGDGFAAC